MSLAPLDKVLKYLIRYGRLEVIEPDGTSHFFGEPGAQPDVAIKMHDERVKWPLFYRPRVAFGEAYSDGRITIERGTLREALELLLKSSDRSMPPRASFPARIYRKFRQIAHRRSITNRIGRARDNVHRHYDISEALYELFLDRDMQYSCAYFRNDAMSLEEAQEAKKQHLAKKLLLKPGMRVLDIGSGGPFRPMVWITATPSSVSRRSTWSKYSRNCGWPTCSNMPTETMRS